MAVVLDLHALWIVADGDRVIRPRQFHLRHRVGLLANSLEALKLGPRGGGGKPAPCERGRRVIISPRAAVGGAFA
jgi:hypothetical protein